MAKRTLKIIAWIIGLITLLFGLVVGFLYWKQDDIKAMVIDSLNENLNGEIKVAAAEISLRKFPFAAIELEEVLGRGSNDLNDTLFQVQSLFLEFHLWDALGDSIPIQALSLENGDVHLIQKGGVNNWSIFKSSGDGQDFNLSIAALKFKDIRFDYALDQDLYLKAYAAEAEAAGIFSSSNWSLNLSLDAYLDEVLYEDASYLGFPLPFILNANLSGAEDILLELAELSIDKIPGFYGSYESKDEGLFLLKHPSLDLDAFLKLYHELQYPWPKELKTKGSLSAELRILPKQSGDTRIEVFAQSDALKLQYADFPAQELKAKIEYYRQGAFDRLELKELSDQAGELQMVGTIRQMTKPQLNLDLKFNKAAEFWQQFIKEGIAFEAGNINGQMKLQGSFPNWESILSEKLNSSNINGVVNLRNLDLALADQSSFEQINGKLRFRNRSILVDSLSMSRGQSDLYFKGELQDLWSYLFKSNGILALRSTLKGERVRLEDFISESEEEADSSGLLSWKDRLQMALDIQVKDFSFRNFKAKNLSGLVNISKGGISGRNIKLLADEGSYRGEFRIAQLMQGLSFDGQLEANNVDVHSVFQSFDDFNQQTITADNLAGRLSVKASIQAPLSNDLRLDIMGLKVQSEMSISEGHLKNYEPMQALSRFAEVEELRDVSFQNLKNSISISDGLIRIPEMAIASNVLNLDLSGTHSFNNEINYLVKLRLGDVLFAKSDREPGNSEFEEHLTISKRDDDHRIPVSIKGTVDQPEISIDPGALGDALEKDLKKQKEELKDIFKKEEPKKKKGTGMTFEWDDGAP